MRISKRNLGLRSLILASLLTGLLSWIQAPSAQASYAIGDTGPAGGKIFILPSSQSGLGVSYYYEVAPQGWGNGIAVQSGETTGSATVDPTLKWCNVTTSVGTTNTAIGTGETNTVLMDTHCTSGAGQAAANYTVTVSSIVYSGWFLPSKDELNQLCRYARGHAQSTELCASTGTLKAGFTANEYWSSSQTGNTAHAWAQYFSGPYQEDRSKNDLYSVRPVRAFSAISAQSALSFTLSTASSTYTGTAYTQALTFTPSGGSGDGATTYAVADGSASSCALSGSSATETITVTTSGTCLITATKAADVNYSSISSSAVTFTFNLLAISTAAVAGVTAPVRGATPVTTTTAGTGYTGTLTWSSSPSAFAASTAYTATITLTAASGYTLIGVSANFFTVTGTSSSATNSADSGVITAVFPATGALSAQDALSFTLSTSSSTYTGSAFTQVMTLTPSGGSGDGATTYAITSGGTATSCALTNSGATPTITATTSGTCLITATKAADVNYSSTSSSAMTFTFSAVISTLSLSLAGGVTTASKGQAIVITATIDQAGKVSFFVDGKRIPKCFKLSASTPTKTCSWKPTVQRPVTLSAQLTPTNSAYSAASGSMKVQITKRTSTR